MDEDCVFCKLIRGDFGTTMLAESENAVAFADIAPAAPVHILVAPKAHLTGLRDLEDSLLWAELLRLVQQTARDQGLLEAGYRVVINDGEGAGQTVWHLHLHVLGGRKMTALG